MSVPTVEATTRYILSVPGWRPVLANELMKAHWRKAASLKRRDVRAIEAANVLARVPLVTLPGWTQRCSTTHLLSAFRDVKPIRRHVAFTITAPFRRLPDPDAPLKSMLDALTRVGLIVDDSDRWCVWDRPVLERGKLRTEIIIEDMG